MERILTVGIQKLDEEKFTPPVSIDEEDDGAFYQINKPNGCLWGSTCIDGEEKGLTSAWLEFITHEFNLEGSTKCISFVLKDAARILTIDSKNDYLALPDKYFVDWGNGKFELPIDKKVINWKAVSEDYDAFHLTYNGILELRNPFHVLADKDGNRVSDFYMWDVESWVMLNLDCIDKESVQSFTITL